MLSKRLRCLLPFLTIGFVLSLSISLSADEIHGRRFKIAWDKDPGAKAYEARFERLGKETRNLNHRLKSNEFSGLLIPGDYLFSVRGFDHSNQPGNWSEPVEIAVPPHKVEAKFPDNKSIIESNRMRDGQMVLRWNASPGASLYRVIVRSEDGLFEESKDVQALGLKIPLEPNRKYEWTVTALTQNGVAGDTWSEPLSFEILMPELPKPKILAASKPPVNELKWKRVKNAESYSGKLYRMDFLGDSWELFKSFKEEKTSVWSLEEGLIPGKYKLSLRAEAKNYRSSEFSELEFVVKPLERDLSSIPEQINQVNPK